MSSLIAEGELVHEAGLVGLEDISALDHVRQSLGRLPACRGRRAYHRGGRMVGCVLLRPEAEPFGFSGAFRRRVFWLLPQDRDTDLVGLYATGAPAEAVDPRTPALGSKGRKTERPEGGPLSTVMRELGITLPL